MVLPLKFIRNLNGWGLIISAIAAVIAWEKTETYT